MELDSNYQTALHLALDTDDPDMELLQLLLRHGADPNARDLQFKPPLHMALEEQSVDAARLLL